MWHPLTTTVDTANHIVTAQAQDLGDFDLQAPLLCPADDLELDDSYYAAKAISTDGTPVSRLFDIAEDEDWFRLEAVAGTDYIIQTDNLTTGVDTVVEIYDLDGLTLLASDDNSGGGAASKLEWQAPLDGIYFLRVAQASGSAYGCDAAYEFSVSQSAITITKTVIPTGLVKFGNELTYTLVISAMPSTQVGLYDPLTHTTFLRFVEPVEDITHTNRAITGTLTVTPTNQVTISFVAQVDAPGTVGWTVTVTNRACVYPVGGTLGGCFWSNEATNPAFRPYSIYLSIVVRNY